jgi:hypothetical protein
MVSIPNPSPNPHHNKLQFTHNQQNQFLHFHHTQFITKPNPLLASQITQAAAPNPALPSPYFITQHQNHHHYRKKNTHSRISPLQQLTNKNQSITKICKKKEGRTENKA